MIEYHNKNHIIKFYKNLSTGSLTSDWQQIIKYHSWQKGSKPETLYSCHNSTICILLYMYVVYKGKFVKFIYLFIWLDQVIMPLCLDENLWLKPLVHCINIIYFQKSKLYFYCHLKKQNKLNNTLYDMHKAGWTDGIRINRWWSDEYFPL